MLLQSFKDATGLDVRNSACWRRLCWY